MKARTRSVAVEAREPWSARLRRRRASALGTVLVVSVAAIWFARAIEPAYRATAGLVIEERTLPAEFDESRAREYALEQLQARHERISAILEAPGGAARPELQENAAVHLTRATVVPSATGPSTVSVAFAVSADRSNSHEAERAVAAAVERYVEDDARTASVPPAPPAELAAARLDSERLGETLRSVAKELELFEQENAAVLNTPDDLGGQATAQLERERRELGRQIAAMEARKIELDRGLRDMQQDAAEYRIGTDEPITSEGLAALQTRWAILRGRYGQDYSAAVELGRQIAELQTRAQQRLEAATDEIATAQAELARLERLHPIDHPDVVRQAHALSALESRLESVRVRGLTSGERAYLEGLGQERREIDGKIEELRHRHAALETRIADHGALAAQAPVVAQRHAALQAKHTDARGRYEAARSASGPESQFDTQLAQKPGRLTVGVSRTPTVCSRLGRQ
jgi:hypothetical protein